MKQAILAVSFGTSYWNTLEKTIGATEQALAEAFPDWKVRRAFTSGIILRKLAQRDGVHIDSVPEAMEKLIEEGFCRVAIQPTHMTHGEEYEKLCSMVEPYRSRIHLSIGMPLLHDLEDYQLLANALVDWLPTPSEDEAIVLMGHGTAHFANASYAQLDYMLSALRQPVYIGTVEGYPALPQVLERLKGQPNLHKILLAPLMLVAGDHAQNDMAGEKDSWKAQLEAQGYQVTSLLQGLGECPAVRAQFATHCRWAIQELENRTGTLYGVGVGPGDPELLTMKAVRILQEADVILVPDSGSSQKAALNTVQSYLQGKTLQLVSTPMVRAPEALDRAYTAIADRICALLEEGKRVAYITLGDPSIYSTYSYVHRRVQERGYPAEIIPGVPSFCAAAARLNTSLCEGKEALLIVPTGGGAGEDTAEVTNRVYMKAGKSILELQAHLRETGALERASMVENCGMEGEKLYPRFADLYSPSGYFSLVIAKGGTP